MLTRNYWLLLCENVGSRTDETVLINYNKYCLSRRRESSSPFSLQKGKKEQENSIGCKIDEGQSNSEFLIHKK